MYPYDFQNKTWKEIAHYIEKAALLFLPIGSTEAHGPHLPLSTDTIISVEMSRRAANLLAQQKRLALVLPPISYSVTDFSANFPGSISISAQTATSLITDLCCSLINQGFKYISIANSHLEPEHINTISTACIEIESKTSVKVCFPDKRRRRWAAKLTEEFLSGACHAGSYETSLVMAAVPDLVKEEIRKQLPNIEISLSTAIQKGIKTFEEAGGKDAYFGFPSQASKQEGDTTYLALAQMLIEASAEAFPDYFFSGERDG